MCRTSVATNVFLFGPDISSKIDRSVSSSNNFTAAATCLVAIAPTIFFDRLGLDNLQFPDCLEDFLVILVCFVLMNVFHCVSHLCYGPSPQKKKAQEMKTSNPKSRLACQTLWQRKFQDLCLGRGRAGFSMWSLYFLAPKSRLVPKEDSFATKIWL